MEFKITIILSHIDDQSVEDMELNAQNYIKEFIEDDELYIESIENITINKIIYTLNADLLFIFSPQTIHF